MTGTSDLRNELEGLFPVRGDAASEYLDQLNALAEQVDEKVLRRPDVSELVGSCPVEVITTNHRNHARFMATVFALDLPSLLVRVIPWAYRVYTIRGVSYEYFEAELSAWMDAAEEHLGAARAEPICRIYRWMLDHHEDMKQLSREVRPFTPSEGDWSDELDALLSCLLDGDADGARRMAEESAPDATTVQNRVLS